MGLEVHDSGWLNPPIVYENFDSSLLQDYCFELSKSGTWYDESCNCNYHDRYGTIGWDVDGVIYHGYQLVWKRKKELIIKDSIPKSIFYRKTFGYLGFIQETTDGAWFVNSPYAFNHHFSLYISGFRNEFYAVRYLHQMTLSRFPDSIDLLPKTLPIMKSDCSKLKSMNVDNPSFFQGFLINYKFVICEPPSHGFDTQDSIWQDYELKDLLLNSSVSGESCQYQVLTEDLVIGYIRESLDNTWSAQSIVHFADMKEAIEVAGFTDKFYAIYYLHQVDFHIIQSAFQLFSTSLGSGNTVRTIRN